MKCPRCQHVGRPRAKFCEECGTPFKRRSQGGPPVASYTDLHDALTAAQAQVTEALEQQTATSEILRVISQSPTDVQPIFDAIVRSAVRLCGGVFSIVLRFDGELVHFVAQHNFDPAAQAVYSRWFPRRAAEDHLVGRALVEQRVMNVPDVTSEFSFVPGQREQGFRSVLFVPMVRDVCRPRRDRDR
jgi:hypothetical protein